MKGVSTGSTWSVLKWAASSKRSNVIKVDFDEEFDAAPLHTQIRDALVANAARVMDLFRELDPNMDGIITKREFEEALPLLGMAPPRETVLLLFESFDVDGSGSIDFHEFYRLLRRADANADAGRKKRTKAHDEDDEELVSISALKRDVLRECSKLKPVSKADNDIRGAAPNFLASAHLSPHLSPIGEGASPA